VDFSVFTNCWVGWVQYASIALSLVAAGLWLTSALIPLPSPPQSGTPIKADYFQELHNAAQKASRRNALAALLAIVTSVAQWVTFFAAAPCGGGS